MKKEQLAIREQTLLSAALTCFATERCEDVSVARIAKLAGVAKGTVYLHFSSKDEICARLAQDFYDSLAEKYNGVSGDGVTRLKKIIEITFNHYRDLHHYRHIVQYCHREHFLKSINPELSQSLQNIGIVRRQRIAQALELGKTDQTLTSNARAKLTGICSTVDGALTNFQVYENTQQNLQIEFFEAVTHYIIDSVMQNKTTTPADNKQPLSPELIPEL